MSDAFAPTHNKGRLAERGRSPRGVRSLDFDRAVGSGAAMRPCKRPGCGHPAFYHNLNPAEGCLWQPAFNDPKRATYEGCGCIGLVRA